MTEGPGPRRDFLTTADVLALHAVLVRRYGGATGVRDAGALEAALFESLAINHPFIDGNKRIAFAAMDVFLRINGFKVARTPMEVYADMMRMLEAGTFDQERLVPWLRACVLPS